MNVEVCAAEIDIDAFRHNLDRVSSLAPQSRVMAVVKANGYGHDLALLLSALEQVDAIAVARVPEALAARSAGFCGAIVVLEGVLTGAELSLAADAGLQLVIHEPLQLKLLSQHRGAPLTVWLKCDSGMNRLGFRPQDFAGVHATLGNFAAVEQPPRLMTHLACADLLADPMTPQQLECFAAATRGLRGEKSVANSAALLGWPASHPGWVRPGLMLYGISPYPDSVGADHGLRPVMRLHTRLIAVKKVAAGATVGYGGTWRARTDTWIGTAAIGYGDGYPGNLPSGTPVLVNGERVPLAGRVSMDMITLDLGPRRAAAVGDEVVLWGAELPVEKLAPLAHRIPYELLCGVSPRVPRVALS